MTIALLLATTATPDGAPAALLPGDDPWPQASAVGALVHAADLFGCEEVVVLTRPAWVGQVTAAVGGVLSDVEVVPAEDGTEERARVVEVFQRAAQGSCGVAVLHGHLVADEVTLRPLLDGQGGNVVLADTSPSAEGAGGDAPRGPTAAGGATAVRHAPGRAELRTLRGRVIAAASPDHELVAPTARSLGAMAVRAGAVGDAARLLSALDEGLATLGSQGGTQRADAMASLLVALVRGGIVVTARPPAQAGVATLVTVPEAARAALERRAAIDVDRVLLQESVKREDGFFTTFLVSSWSPLVVRGARRLGLTPDAVTWLSMGLGVLAAVAFAVGVTAWSAAGAVLLYLAFVLDCVDGQLARTIRRFSARGAWLDAMFDRGKEYVVYAGLAVGAVRAGDDAGVWLLAGAALALQTVRHTLDLGYAAQQAADVERLVRRDLAEPHDPGPSFWEVGHGVAGAAPTELDAAGAGAAEGASGTAARSGVAASAPHRPALPRRVILALRRAETVAVLKWAKRIVVLPIGERFALIAVLAVVATPRVVFAVLLLWGGLATLYTAGGRVVRSLA